MDTQQTDDTINVIQFLAAAYDVELTPERIMAYIAGLNDQPYLALLRVAQRWVQTEKWFPKVSELRHLLAQSNHSNENGDPIIERLLIEYDRALAGSFDPERWMQLILRLRVSDREAAADAWRQRYDNFVSHKEAV